MLSFLRNRCAPASRRTSRGAPQSAAPRLGLEALEAREVPAVSIGLDFPTRTLIVNADTSSPNNVVVVKEAGAFGTNVMVYNSTGAQTTFRNGYSTAVVSSIVFNGSAGRDYFANTTDLPSTIFGNAGDDTLIGGSNLDAISGGPGNDTINGGDATLFNSLQEAGDADYLLVSSAGNSRNGYLQSTRGFDQLINIGAASLTGGNAANLFDTTNWFGGQVRLNGMGGRDTFRVRPDIGVVDGGDNVNLPGGVVIGDVIEVKNVSSASISGGSLTMNGRTLTVRNVENLDLTGTAGTDLLDLAGYTGNTFLTGLGGDDTIRGGSGTNRIDGGAGSNVILPSSGQDFIIPPAPGGTDLYGLANRTLTPTELSATGSLRAVLRAVGQAKALDLFGPTGAGFTIEGDWSTVALGSGEGFALSGAGVLKTPLGDVPISSTAELPLIVATASDSFPGYGIVTAVTWNAPMALTTAAAPDVLNFFQNTFGLTVSVPGVSWGLALGSVILETVDRSLPINPAVPYLYATLSTGGSANFGGVTVSAGGGATLTVVFDPSDPSLYLSSSIPVPFEVGLSAKGYLPFQSPTLPAGAPAVYGNLLAGGKIDLGAVPVTIGGRVVVDLDANGDGNLVGITPQVVTQLITQNNDLRKALTAIPQLAFNDVAIAVTGTAGIGYTKAGFSITLDTTNVTLVYSPGQVSFRGEMLDPLRGTPLEFFNFGTLAASGTVTFTGDVNITLEGGLGGLLGTFVPTGGTLNLTNTGITFKGVSRDLLGIGKVELNGTVNFQGKFSLSGTGGLDIAIRDPIVNNVLASSFLRGDALLTNITPAGGVSFTASLSAGVTLPVISFQGNLEGKLTIVASPGGVQFDASGVISGTLAGTTTFAGWAASNNRIAVQLGTFGISIPLNLAPAFTERSVTPAATQGERVTLRGRITEPNPDDSFTLRVDWGDGQVETFTFPPGSDGRLVEVTHRYRAPSPVGEPYRVKTFWTDPQGTGNGADFAVDIFRDLRARKLADPTEKALRVARKWGEVEQVFADFNGDNMRDLLVLDRSGGSPVLLILDGGTGAIITRVENLRGGPQTVSLVDRNNHGVSFVVDYSRKRNSEVVTLRDPFNYEVILTARF